MSRFIFFAGLVLLPIIHLPQEVNGFEGPKIIFFQWWVEFIAACSLLYLLYRRQHLRVDKKWFVLLLGYLGWNFFASFIGADFQTSFYGQFWRGQGLLLLVHYLALAMVVPVVLKPFNVRVLGIILVVSSVVAGLYLFWSILANRFFGLSIYLYLDRPVGSFGNPNFLGGFLAICLPFCFSFKSAWVRLLTIVILVTGILLSGSRGAVVAVVGGVVVLGMIWLLRRNLFLGAALMAVIFMGVLLAGFYWLPVPLSSPTWPASRQRIWVRGVQAALKKPIIGYGLENYELAVRGIDFPKKLDLMGEVRVDKAHNEVLEILLASGVVGLALWTGIVFLTLRAFLLQRQYVVLAALLIFLIKAQTNVVSTSEYVLFWMLVGVAVNIRGGNQHSSFFGKGRR